MDEIESSITCAKIMQLYHRIREMVDLHRDVSK